MVEPINLNKIRKARAKAQAKEKGAQNRTLFGLKKTEKIVSEMEAARTQRKLNQAKLDKAKRED